MKSVIFVLVCISVSSTACAQPLMETRDEARQRQSAERYQQYQQNGNRAPLGGYNERLGDSAPRGTERPGYVSPQGYGNNYQPRNSSGRNY